MKAIHYGLLLLVISFIGSNFTGCTKVYTSDGVGHREGIPCKKERMRGCVQNTSTFYEITFYLTSNVGFEIKPGVPSPEFEVMGGQYYRCCIEYYRNNHGMFPSEKGTDYLEYPVNYSKRDAITNDGRVLDFVWDWPGPGGVARGGWR